MSHTLDYDVKFEDFANGDSKLVNFWDAYTIFGGLNLTQLDIVGNVAVDERLTPQLHESAGGLPSLKLSLHSCSLPGSTNAMGIETSIALVLPAREHECNGSFNLRRPLALL
ncbi:hypothetical protein Tco_1277353 [Tanacetum coccineum]